MTDRYIQLTRVIATQKTNAIAVARIFLEDWLENSGITSILLIKNGLQFVSKFFMVVYSTLEANKNTITDYHPESNGRVMRFNWTNDSRLRHYMSEHQSDCDTYLLPLKYK